MRYRDCIFAVLLAALVFMAFGAAMSFGIVNLDDPIYLIQRAPDYGWKWAFTWTGDGMWTPLTWLSHWADRSLFGENWSNHHIHSLLLHGVGAALFYGLLRVLFRRSSCFACLVAAALWALHPLRVESVVWLASRKDVLSTAFFVAALIVWFRWDGLGSCLAALLLLSLGGMAKSSVMVFPVFALAGDALVLGRHRAWYHYAFPVALSLGLAFEASAAQSQGGAGFVSTLIPSWYRVLNAVCATTVYCGNLFLPNDLAAQCVLRFPEPPRFSSVGLAVAVLAAAYAVGFVRRCVSEKRVLRDPVMAGIAVFFISLVPFLGLVGFGCHSFADRFTILPSIGLSLAVLGFAERTPIRFRPFCTGALATAAAVLAVQTSRQVAYWRSDETLFSHTLAVDGGRNAVAHMALAVYYYEFPHDYAKILPHAEGLMNCAPWQQFMTAHLGPILLEAALEVGRADLADDLYCWQYRWGRERVKWLRSTGMDVDETETMKVSDAIRLAYRSGLLENARKLLGELQEDFPNHFAVRNLNYIIARREGDDAKTAMARKAAYAPDGGEPVLRNRWALAGNGQVN